MEIGTTISLLPSALKQWKPQDYISSDNTYYYAYDQSKPTALEVVDPGCIYCGKLFANIKTANFESSHNLTYILYPIPSPNQPSGYKFANSYLIATYVEAAKFIPPAHSVSNESPDWQLLEKVYTERDAQSMLDYSYNSAQAEDWLKKSLSEIGYDNDQVSEIAGLEHSPAIQQQLAQQRSIVEKQIKTVKIPTIIFGGDRFQRVISPQQLK